MATITVTTHISRNVSGTWSDISSYVVGDLEGEYRIPSNDADDLLSAVGELKFVMNNGSGLFSPNANFQRGTPILVTTTYDGVTKIRFLGNILELNPDTLEWGDQFVDVVCADWMNFAVKFPIVIPAIQSNMRVENAVAYILSLMEKQPESTVFHTGRELFNDVFDTTNRETKAYSEFNKLALSEFAPIYVRAGNILVVESADTRNGLRELTTVPVITTESAYLAQENSDFILQENGDQILVDQKAIPRISGTFMDISMEGSGRNLVNQVSIRAFPSRVDVSPQVLFQLNEEIEIPALSSYELRGTWANPNGGSPINAQNIVLPLVTGTNYIFRSTDGLDGDFTEFLIIRSFEAGADGFVADLYNSTHGGRITKFSVSGYGIYKDNPIELLVGVTGSMATQGVVQMAIDQKYQDTTVAGGFIANIITDDEKDPRNRLMSATFDASSSSELMQASQFMDIGDLTYVSNAKPYMDTYAYIHGKKFVITPAGIVTERWYLKEMDSLRKGLKPIALNTPVKNGTKGGVNFGRPPHLADLSKKTITAWHKVSLSPTFPPLSKFDGVNGWHFFITNGKLQFRQNFTPNDGQWETPAGLVTGTNTWRHVGVTYDNSSPSNDPIFYVDGVQVATIETASPSGVVDTDANANLVVGNLLFPSFDWFYNQWGSWADVRLYNVIKTPSHFSEMAVSRLNVTSAPDGMVFQAPTVKTEDYGNLTGTILNPDNKIIDNVFGIRGTPNWNTISGTTFAMKAYDIT